MTRRATEAARTATTVARARAIARRGRRGKAPEPDVARADALEVLRAQARHKAGRA